MKTSEHDLIKYFLRSSIDHFQISPAQSHAALMTFGQEAEVVFDFNVEQNWQNNLKPRIDQLNFVPGKGRLVDVLKLACDNIFCAAGGTRNNVPKVSQFSPTLRGRSNISILCMFFFTYWQNTSNRKVSKLDIFNTYLIQLWGVNH